MVTIDEVYEFLSGYGYGYGSGSGSGDGYGDGSGSGSGYGYGYSSGSGSGDGYGYGSGSGDGYGDGSGDGSGSGDGDGSGSGDGDGSGDGYGDGSGSGSGYGSGDGSGSGSGYGSGWRLKKINNMNVYYIDGIPCALKSIHHDYAMIQIVHEDMTLEVAYICRYKNCIAHGESVAEAVAAATDKYYSSLEWEEVRVEFLRIYRAKKELSGYELYDWHHRLTGSCKFGRDKFVEDHNLDLAKKYSLTEFVEICGAEYGGDKIRSLTC